MTWIVALLGINVVMEKVIVIMIVTVKVTWFVEIETAVSSMGIWIVVLMP